MKPTITVLCIGLLLPWPLHAAVPAFVTYSGRLTDGTGWGESTEATLVFRVYDSATGATPFWTGTHPDVPVVDGYFAVNLGMCNTDGSACTVNPVEATFPGDIPDQMWVGVVVEGVELERQPVGSMPYAFAALDSDRLAGQPASSYLGFDLVLDQVTYQGATAWCVQMLGSGSKPVYMTPQVASGQVGKLVPTCKGVLFAYQDLNGSWIKYDGNQHSCTQSIGSTAFWPWSLNRPSGQVCDSGYLGNPEGCWFRIMWIICA